MKTQVVSCAVSFVSQITGSTKDDSELSPEEKEEGKQLLMPYSEELVGAINAMFSLSISENYRPLQEETLILLSSLATSLSELFASHY